MDAANIVKSNLTPSKLIGGAIVIVVVLAIADAAGVTNWVVYPYSSAKAKFGKQGS